MNKSFNKFYIVLGEESFTHLGDLESVPCDLSTMSGIFRDFGYQRIEASSGELTTFDTLREWLQEDGRSPQDILAIYYSGHGLVDPGGRYYLAKKKTDLEKLAATAEDLGYLTRQLVESPVCHFLIMIDACGAAKGAQNIAAEPTITEFVRPYASDSTKTVNIISAVKANEVARQGLFTSAFHEVIASVFKTTRYPSGTTDIGMYLSLQQIVQEMDLISAQKPSYHCCASTIYPPFFPNPFLRENPDVKVGPIGDQLFHTWFESLIHSKGSHLLLDAEVMWDDVKRDGAKEAHFEHTSGHFSKKFLSVWELFNKRGQLESTINALAVDCSNHYENTAFDVLVTCTATSNEIGRLVIKRLKGLVNRSIPHLALEYPATISALSEECGNYREANALILTDVVVTGTLIADMIEVLQYFSINVTGVAAIVLGHADAADEARNSNNIIYDAKLRSGRHELTLSYLAYYGIDLVPPEQVNPDYVLHIDHRTVLPAYGRKQHQAAAPLFKLEEAIELLDQADALTVGIFEVDGRPTHFRVDLELLLDSVHAKKIVDKFKGDGIKPDFLSAAEFESSFVVTTYKQEDLRFKYFLDDWLHRQGKQFAGEHIIKRSTRDSIELISSFLSREEEIRDQKVVVLLGTSSSSEKLRAIVGLLSTLGARSISVVTLVNRFGIYTNEFLSWLGARVTAHRDIEFSFKSVFAFSELNGDKFARSLAVIHNKLAEYEQWSRVPAFGLAAQLLRDTFSPGSVNLPAGSFGQIEYSALPYKGAPRSLDAVICERICDYARTGKFKDLDFFLNKNIIRTLNHLVVAIVVSEPAAAQGAIGEGILKKWLGQLRDCRKRRIELEQPVAEMDLRKWPEQASSPDGSLVVEQVAREEVLLESIALLSPFVKGELPSFKEFFGVDYLGRERPLNTFFALKNERITSASALYLYLSSPDLAKEPEGLDDTVTRAVMEVDALSTVDNPIHLSFVARAKECLSALPFEFIRSGRYTIQQAIQLLHVKLIERSDNEKRLFGAFRKCLDFPFPKGHMLASFPQKNLGQARQSIWHLLELYQVADAATRLIGVVHPDHPRFSKDGDEPSVSADLALLTSFLRDVYADALLSKLKIREIMAALDRLKSDFFGADSSIRDEVQAGISDLRDVIDKSVKVASNVLKNQNHADPWNLAWVRFCDAFPDRSVSATVSPTLLGDALTSLLVSVGTLGSSAESPLLETTRSELIYTCESELGASHWVIVACLPSAFESTRAQSLVESALEEPMRRLRVYGVSLRRIEESGMTVGYKLEVPSL